MVVVLEGFGVVLWCGRRIALWYCNERGDFLQRISLMLVVGNMYVVAGAFLFGMVIWFGFFLDFLGFAEWMEEVGVLLWSWSEVWGWMWDVVVPTLVRMLTFVVIWFVCWRRRWLEWWRG